MKDTKNIFEGIKKVHLIGIGGIGMSGIAEYLAKKGYEVTGTDISASPVTRRLEKLKIKFTAGHHEVNMPNDTELVIYSAAVSEDNDELVKAREMNMKIVKRAEALGNIVNDKFVIAVSGTHGKTTTTAMIAKILMDSRIDPTVFVGGNIEYLDGGSSRIGMSNIAVVEADEYDRSFLQLKANILVITNIDADHLDIFKDIEDIKSSFRKFIDNSKKDVKVIACGDEKNVTDVVKDINNKITYGFKKSNTYPIEDVSFDKSSIGYRINNEDIRIKVLGKHNILNSAAAYLVATELKINDEVINESMKTFFGVKRRLELKFDNGVKIYDDYAHHPTEVRATLDAIKKVNPSRVITVFQPHLYSRTKDFYKEFAESFSGTDILLLAKIYPAREKAIEGVTSELILNEYNKAIKSGQGKEQKLEGYYVEDNEKILNLLESIRKEGDVIIFQGAGDITDLCDVFVRRVKVKSNWTVPL
ncbi:MAG: UDP-N-acetylmuramate--L-alanine ligase [Ignavibacteria bacterium]